MHAQMFHSSAHVAARRERTIDVIHYRLGQLVSHVGDGALQILKLNLQRTLYESSASKHRAGD
jgi:hypothetical protein